MLFRSLGKEKVMLNDPLNNPYIFESEMISPFAEILPGEIYTWKYDWYASSIGGNYKITYCTPVGITAEPLIAKPDHEYLKINGRFGVFSPGTIMIRLHDAAGNVVKEEKLSEKVSPLKPVVIEMKMKSPVKAASVSLSFYDVSGKEAGILANAVIMW